MGTISAMFGHYPVLRRERPALFRIWVMMDAGSWSDADRAG